MPIRSNDVRRRQCPSRCLFIGLLLFTVSLSSSFIGGRAQSASCDEALLDVEFLPDSAFTATSNSEKVDQPVAGLSSGVDHSAKTARDMVHGGWCPSRKVSTNLTEFIQVDMGAVNVITKIAFGPRSNVAHTPSFVIRYRREGSTEWRDYRACASNSTLIIPGVESNLDLKLISLNPPLVARWVRIYPYSRSPMFVCAKFEFYGCGFSDELVEYKAPEGSDFHLSPFSAPLSLRDTCYDGQRDPRRGALLNGVGCLTDSRVSTRTKSFQVSPWQQHGSASVASSFNADCLVGWNRSRWEDNRRPFQSSSSSSSPAVDLVFRFSGLRVFENLNLYALNIPIRKVRIPRRLEVSFSPDGSTFPAAPDIAQDIQAFDADPLLINLKRKSGRAVQLRLFFADEWIVLSETRFTSEAATKEDADPTGGEDEDPLQSRPKDSEPNPSAQSHKSEMDTFPSPPGNVGPNNADDFNSLDVDEDLVHQQDLISEANGGPLHILDPPTYQGPTMLVLILVFICCFMLLLVGVTCFSIAWMQKRRRKKKKRQSDLHGEMQSMNDKLLKGHSGSAGLFRWPGLSIATGGNNNASAETTNSTVNGVSQPSFDSGLGYMSVPNTDYEYTTCSLLSDPTSCSTPLIIYPANYFGYTGNEGGGAQPPVTTIASVQTGDSGSNRPLAKRLLNSVASRLFRSRHSGGGGGNKGRIFSHSTHHYEQVLAPSAHSSPVANPDGGFQSHQNQALPPFPVNSLPVHTANGLIQIDLKRSHPSLIVNGHPMLQFQQQQQQNQQQQQQSQQQQQQQGPDPNQRLPNYFPTFNNRHPTDSSVVYQSVHGESDVDSLGASTMSPDYASASILGGQSGPNGGMTFMGWGVGEYSTAQRPGTVDVSAQAFYSSPQPPQPHQGMPPAYAWASQNGAFVQRSFSQQKFHQPMWNPPNVNPASSALGHEATSSTHSGESSDQFSGRISGVIGSGVGGGGGGGSGVGGSGSLNDPPSTIYGFTSQS